MFPSRGDRLEHIRKEELCTKRVVIEEGEDEAKGECQGKHQGTSRHNKPIEDSEDIDQEAYIYI